MPRLSVCITHYNRPNKLAATLESLAAQTRLPDEVFLWDDCSPNDPSEVVKSFDKRFPHFVYHRNRRNLNMPGNLNAVISQATGDYVANLHDADTYHPTLLEKWERTLESHPSAGLVFCGYDLSADSRGGTNICIHPIPTLIDGRELFEKWFVGNTGSVIWGTVMVRKQAYAQFLPFDPTYRNWADVDMWLRMCGSFNIAYVAEPLIALDNSVTPLRRFSWYRVLLYHSLVLENINKLFSDNVLKQCELRTRQVQLLRRSTIRYLLGAIRWRDWNRIRAIYPFVPDLWSANLNIQLLESVRDHELGG